MVKKRIDEDKEWRIIDKLSKGKDYARIAWDEGVSYSTVTNTRDRFPLFSFHKED